MCLSIFSPSDIRDPAQGPESGAQRDRQFRLRGPGQPAPVSVLDPRRVPGAHVPQQCVRTLSRDPRGHAANPGCSEGGRRISRVLRAVRRRVGHMESVLTSAY